MRLGFDQPRKFPVRYLAPVRFAEKTSRNIVPADLLWEKNTVLTEKKQAKILFRLICCERKTIFRLKKEVEKYGL